MLSFLRPGPAYGRSILSSHYAQVSRNLRGYATANKAPAVEKPLLGRPSNNLKMGICGLPNTGKSSFFNALTDSAVPAENFPFCTISPNEARVAVPDERFDWLVDFYKPTSQVPAYLTVIDIAGLVKGAAEGEGLGNAFLSNISAVDGIFHLCRGFTSSDIIHVEGRVDPVADLEIIHEELRLKDEDFLTRQLEVKRKEAGRVGKGGAVDQRKREEYETIQKIHDWVVVRKKEARYGEWTPEEIEVLNALHLLTAKPAVYLCNISEQDYVLKTCEWTSKIQSYIDEHHPGDLLITYSGELETALAEMTPDEQELHLRTLAEIYEAPEQPASVLPSIILAGYDALQLSYFFTGGSDEVRAWTIRRGAKAPQAAGVIHSDFEKTFAMAEVMKFDDLKALGSEDAVKNAGKFVQKGRDYVVEDGDIMHFKAGQAAGKKR
ncbi:P-loop containing nucleoside triphosphate hydrolase protein [Powellomyces hirtus]|nr:P-loop containing nucleoside triphosphate hydrolase protein [Powellomyces hirtus]